MILKTFALLLLSGIIQFLFLTEFSITGELITNLIVFLSILFGFCATSLAIFTTSRYVKDLAKVIDSNTPTQSLLDTLVGRYKKGLFFALGTVLYLILVQFSIENLITSATGSGISLSSYFSYLIIPSIILNFYYGFMLLQTLSRIVIQEGKGARVHAN